jgi:hypothetical protein
VSEAEQTELGTTAVRAVTAAAVSGAATYAVRKTLAARNGHDDQNAANHKDSNRKAGLMSRAFGRFAS